MKNCCFVFFMVFAIQYSTGQIDHNLENVPLKDTLQSNIISADELEGLFEDAGMSNQISGVLTSGRDLFSRTVAFEFSPTFFKARGLDSRSSKIAINGISMNKTWNGRPNWSNWGGLNEATRYQEFSFFTDSSPYFFGDLGGTVNISTLTKDYRKGLRISYANSNRLYSHRWMMNYHHGQTNNHWDFMVSASLRTGESGFRAGTPYDSQAFFAAVSKEISYKHFIQFTAFLSYNYRGKSAPMTQEVFRLKDERYNSYWGYQGDKKRNSRMQEISEPVFMLNHIWKINSKTQFLTNIAYQFGKTGNSRLDYSGNTLINDPSQNSFLVGGGTNPDPTYYQKLPSYFLRFPEDPDYTKAYLAEQDFLENGQINWSSLYQANKTNADQGLNAAYALYEDRIDEKVFQINSIINGKISKKIDWVGSLSYLKSRAENYAKIKDLLGGNGYLDVNAYADNLLQSQNDLQNPNRLVEEGKKFKYNFNTQATVFQGFLQANFNFQKGNAYLGLQSDYTNYAREGLYENGRYPKNESFGKSDELQFLNVGIKGGTLYKISGRHLISTNAFFATKSPTLQNSFSNIRENNQTVLNLESEKNLSLDVNYWLRHSWINAKISGYFIQQNDVTSISFYYADGLMNLQTDETSAFVQEVKTGMNLQSLGMEFSAEIPIISGFKLNAVALVGESVHNNNPDLYLTSDDFTDPIDLGKTSLKKYHLANGPQQAFSLGISYSSPNYWWFNLTGNYFRNSYIQTAPILRTANFLKDSDGLPLLDYDETIAKNLLKQEEIVPFNLFNLAVGKSWKINKHYVSAFLSVSNLTNTQFKTGGFEQSRNANYNTLLEDQKRVNPLFGSKYWFGLGTNYFFSISWSI